MTLHRHTHTHTITIARRHFLLGALSVTGLAGFAAAHEGHAPVDITVLQILELTPGCADFLKLIRETGLASLFSDSRPVTLFAPFESTWTRSAAAQAMLSASLAEREKWVLRHACVGGRSAKSMADQVVRSFDNSPLRIDAAYASVNGIAFSAQDIEAKNGYIHLIKSAL